MKVLRRRPIRRSRVVSLLPLLAVACGSSSSDSDVNGAGFGGSPSGGSAGSGGAQSDGGGDAGCLVDEIVCEGSTSYRCNEAGQHVDPVDCSAAGTTMCVNGLGCVNCVPGAASCEDGVATYCMSDGMTEEQFECDPLQGLTCTPDGCEGACTPQVLGKKHIGCDFWPTVTANSVWGEWFDFGVVVANTTSEPANLVVTRGDVVVAERPLDPAGVAIVELPWVDDLKGPEADMSGAVVVPTESVFSSSALGAGAYRLRSDQPVVVTQFSTLSSNNEEGLAAGCPPDMETGACLSYSNDATLLMPGPTLGTAHVLMGWHSWPLGSQNEPGGMGDFVSITALRANTTVKVKAPTALLPLPGEDPFEPGELREVVLAQGDVLQLFTNASSVGAQWSGAEVSADLPIQVITGAPCVYIPDTVPTCDHIEEANLPENMLGKTYLVTAPTSPSGRNRHIIRLHGMEDDTLVEFDPPSTHSAVTMGRGDVVELDLLPETDDEIPPDFLVSSAKTFGVTQYMVGNRAEPYSPYVPEADLGDPSQTVLVPTSRYLKRYVIALPPGFERHYVDVIAATGSDVLLNGEPLDSSQFRAIGASGLSVTRLEALAVGARHELVSDKAFGVQIRGFGKFTSYMVPGGIDLRTTSQ